MNIKLNFPFFYLFIVFLHAFIRPFCKAVDIPNAVVVAFKE